MFDDRLLADDTESLHLLARLLKNIG